MHTKTHIRTLMHGYEHTHKQVYTRWNKMRFATNQHVLRSWTRTAKRMNNQWNAAFAETVRGAGNGPGSKGRGVAKACVSQVIYSDYSAPLPQPNISYDGNRCATCGRGKVVLPHRLAARTAAMNTVTPRIPNTAIHSPHIPFRGPPLDNN